MDLQEGIVDHKEEGTPPQPLLGERNASRRPVLNSMQRGYTRPCCTKYLSFGLNAAGRDPIRQRVQSSDNDNDDPVGPAVRLFGNLYCSATIRPKNARRYLYRRRTGGARAVAESKTKKEIVGLVACMPVVPVNGSTRVPLVSGFTCVRVLFSPDGACV